jgi:hypothetical protein
MGMGPGLFQIFVAIVFFRAPLGTGSTKVKNTNVKKYQRDFGPPYQQIKKYQRVGT